MTFILYKLLEIAKLKFSFFHLTTKKRRIKGVQINVESEHITLILCHQTIGCIVASDPIIWRKNEETLTVVVI